MQVNSTTSSAATGSAAGASGTAAKSATVNYDSFLKILIAEMKNQDPTQPSDPAQYVSQLSSFSAVEQQVNTNTKLDGLMTMLAMSQAGSVIGHTVTSADGTVSGKVASVQIISNGATATLEDGQQIALGAGIQIE